MISNLAESVSTERNQSSMAAEAKEIGGRQSPYPAQAQEQEQKYEPSTPPRSNSADTQSSSESLRRQHSQRRPRGRALTQIRDFPSAWERHFTLDEGGEGIVSLYKHKRKPDTAVVAKVVKFQRSASARIPHEADLLTGIQSWVGSDGSKGCSRLISCLGCELDVPRPRRATILLEHCPGGDLNHYKELMNVYGERVPEPFIWRVLVQLAQALAFLHSGCAVGETTARCRWSPWLHRDIKPENILLTVDPGDASYPLIKLADFGYAQPPEVSRRVERFFGTVDWAPPERCNSMAGDVWSLGAVVHYMAIGDPPLESFSNFTARWAQTPGYEMPVFKTKEEAESHWGWEAHRIVTPINLTPAEQALRWGPEAPVREVYSDKLNAYMIDMLRYLPGDRLSAVGILQRAKAQGLAAYLERHWGQAATKDLELKRASVIGLTLDG